MSVLIISKHQDLLRFNSIFSILRCAGTLNPANLSLLYLTQIRNYNFLKRELNRKSSHLDRALKTADKIKEF